MKPAKRFLSAMLSLVMAFSLLVPGLPQARAEESAVQTGSIGLTVCFDLPQTAKSAESRNVQLTVSRGGQSTVVPLPSGKVQGNGLNASVSAEEKNSEGVARTTESQVGYYEVELSGLPAGGAQYELALTGKGYKPFLQSVKLEGYSQHIIVSTGDGSFALGDMNGDGAVNAADLSAMDGQLGKENADYDLNGDGRVDVTDLAYVNHNQNASGGAQVLDTAAIVTPRVEVAEELLQGSADDLFRDEGTVTIAPSNGAVELPIVLDSAGGVEMSEIRITCPDGIGGGAVEAGTVLAELADGSPLSIPFDAARPADLHAIDEEEGQRVVTIDLGKKVAVKKITIQVTRTANETGFATITKIEFLKDIVPENPENDAGRVKGVTTAAGDGQVTLTWDAVRNVTGYIVAYGPSASDLGKTVSVNTNRAVISGLDNQKTCYFQVTAVNGDWRGAPSKIVSDTPQPSNRPGAPSNIRVTESDQSLRVSWGSTKDASYYQLFYREAGQSAFQQSGGSLSGTSAVITGLTNGVKYEVAVKAGNLRGTGPYSATASGTPKKESLDMPDLPVGDRIDNSMIQSVVMKTPSNVNRSLCPSFTTAHVVDNDAATYWVANQWWDSSMFTYTFKEPQKMNYAILVPYLGGNYKNALKTYTVSAKNSAGEELLAATQFSAPAMDPNKNYLVLTFPMLEDVKELSISLAEREGNGCRVSISEMAFYNSDSLADDIAALFSDGSFTALKSGVTAETISALSQRLEAKADFYLDLVRLKDELALASALLENNSDALGLVKSGFESRSAGKDKSIGQSASSLQPLGVSARAGAVMAVYAALPGDEPVYVSPTQYYGEFGVWQAAGIRLVNGRNYITAPQIGSLTDPRGGPLYVTYGGSHPEQIKLQVRGDGNTFTIPVLELSGWYDLSETARKDTIRAYMTQLQSYVSALGASDPKTDVRNATEISTPSILLSIPADQAWKGLHGVNASMDDMTETMYQNVLAWEDELYVANQVQGIIPSAGARGGNYRYPMTTRQNIRYMRMFAGAFMYAAGNHIGVGYGSTQALVSGRPVSQTGTGKANGLFGWGIAHEIGHNMDKLGKAEITNNIYSLAMQAWDGAAMAQNTRLTLSNVWPRIFAKTAAGRPGAAGDVFVQLGMYWQLHLAYDEADQPLDFYNRFFTAWKNGAYEGRSYDERVALIASETAGRDLSQFFAHWGMTLSDTVKETLSKLPAEERAVWYLNDEAYAYRLKDGKGFAGEVSVSAQVDQNQVKLTIEGGNDSILGYEVLRDGTAIGFTTNNTYADDLGAANNLTYTYSVIPVDKLGIMGAEAKAEEVRVAYSAVISSDLYTVSREGEDMVATMKANPAAVTGLKVTGGSLEGCTVHIQAKPGAEEIQAALGPVDKEQGLVYFTKPGAEKGDTRIWTYDVYALRVSGPSLPDGAKLELLDYPGDRVDLYKGASVGRLAQDLKNGDETIPAGTLVIIGAYRGDPVYNTVEVQVRYDTTDESQDGEKNSAYEERAMNGYTLLYAEIPDQGEVSDTSDGFWLFVPDLEAEAELNKAGNITSKTPMEFRVLLHRTDTPDSADSGRVTSQTLWTSFPETDTLPKLSLTGTGVQ